MTVFQKMIRDFKAGNYQAVVDSAGHVLESAPTNDLAWRALGSAYFEMGESSRAITAMRKSIASNPLIPETYFNLGNFLKESDQPDLAYQHYCRSVALVPLFTEANNNLGNSLKELRRFDEAITRYEKAAVTNPSYIEAFWNIAVLNLLRGNFVDGWRQYEWRWRRKSLEVAAKENDHRRWDGRVSLAGKTLLIHSEQGLGDSLHFCRFVSRLPSEAGKVIVAVEEPLVRLFRTSFPTVTVHGKQDPTPEFDYHCPLMSLPHVLRLGADHCSILEPYLKVGRDTSGSPPYQSRTDGKMRIGLAWSGNQRLENDRNRSIPIEKLLKYLPEGHEYFSLQKDIRPTDIPPLRDSAIKDLSCHLNDFQDTAELCASMDLVIAADTSVAHLAGALFVPTWILLPYTPDWRWGTTGTNTLWYPTAKLYRQFEDRSWDTVLKTVSKDLTSIRS